MGTVPVAGALAWVTMATMGVAVVMQRELVAIAIRVGVRRGCTRRGPGRDRLSSSSVSSWSGRDTDCVNERVFL